MSIMSESEGEIIESDIDKATTKLPSTNGISVNRRLREALSPSHSPTSPPPVNPRQSRSRSPYRSDRSPRGEKRRRNSEHRSDRTRTDPRQFKVHYEGRAHVEDDRRSLAVHKDAERSYEAKNTHEAWDERYHNRNKRPRTRSRSPARRSRGHARRERLDNGGDVRYRGERDKYGYDGSTTKSFREQSVSERGDTPPTAPMSKRETETSFAASQYNNTVSDADGDKEFVDLIPFPTIQPSLTNYTSDSSGKTGRTSLKGNEDDSAPKAEDEVISIEERRRRREAIKAKYKGQATPLLVQALQLGNISGSPSTKDNTSPTATPRSASPSDSSPGSPFHGSGPYSPQQLPFSTDADLGNNIAATSPAAPGDSPSAADYDPTMDMKEDVLRDQKRHRRDSIPAIAYSETKKDVQKDQAGQAGGQSPGGNSKQKRKPVDDMFASDEEDDANDAHATEIKKSEHAMALPQAKQLDQSLLDNWDDPDGYYRFISGELLDGRYTVQANLGKGMFSSVVRALDSKTKTMVAIKIIRNNETMLKAGTKEMEILQKLANADPDDKKHVIRLERSFSHKGHLCMVFENLSINLREVLKKFGRDVGINLKAVRTYAQQMLLGLSLLRKCNILHADLKPDNILVNEGRNILKICDLGSAADASENDITPYLVSRFYRAPEIILGVPYDFAIDMWSVGCTLFELYTGKILFTGRTNNQMLKSMMECRGKFSLKMLKKAEFGGDHFDEITLDFKSMERDRVTGRDVTKLINYLKPVKDLKTKLLATANATAAAGSSNGKKGALADAEMKEVVLFADLLDRCLALNPERRITPSEALKHPFIMREKVPTFLPGKR